MLTKGNEGFPDQVSIVFNGGDLPNRVDLLHVPLWHHPQVDVDLLCLDALSSCQEANPLTTKRRNEMGAVTANFSSPPPPGSGELI